MPQRSFSCLTKASAIALATAASLTTAHAATSWSANYGGCSSGTIYATSGNWSELECAVETGGVDSDVAGIAWKYSDSSSTLPPTGPTAISGPTATARNASVVSWGGNGLGTYAPNDDDTTGPHAIDNGNKFMDSIVLQFSQAVTMNALSLGWQGSDSDVTVFAWTGASQPNNPTPTSLTSGWTTVAQLNTGASSYNFGNAFSSSYWLVAALGNDGNVDSFKLLSVAGLTGGGSNVPEPGSLALLGLGAAGLLVARRKSVARR